MTFKTILNLYLYASKLILQATRKQCFNFRKINNCKSECSVTNHFHKRLQPPGIQELNCFLRLSVSTLRRLIAISQHCTTQFGACLYEENYRCPWQEGYPTHRPIPGERTFYGFLHKQLRTKNKKQQGWLRGRVAPGGRLFTLKVTIGASQLFSINTFDNFYLAYQGHVWTNTACVQP